MEFGHGEEVHKYISDMTFGGSIDIHNQLARVDLRRDQVVNPFLNLHMDNIVFTQVLLQTFQVILPSFGDHINVIPSIPASHLPTSLFSYMD